MLVDWVDMRLRVLLVALTVGLALGPLAAPLLAAERILSRRWSFVVSSPSFAIRIRSGVSCWVGRRWRCACGVWEFIGGSLGGVAQVASRTRHSLVWVGSGAQFGDVLAECCAGMAIAPGFRFFLGLLLGAGVGAVLLLPVEFIATSFLTVGRRQTALKAVPSDSQDEFVARIPGLKSET